MKQAFTWLLFLAASLLLHPSGALAQASPPQLISKAQRALPALRPQNVLPPGVPALRHPLPGNGANRLTNRPARVRSGQKVAAAARGVSAQDVTTGSATEVASEVWIALYRNNRRLRIADMTVDAAGNTYVTGSQLYAVGTFAVADYITLKYSPSGQQLWESIYNSSTPLGTGSYDAAAAITVDATGNVYVTGSSGLGYATLKYSPSGQELWVVRGFAGGKDIAVDGTGNVYVTGNQTAKYTVNGQLLWTALGGSHLVVNVADNVYVTGGGTTRKYAANGQQLWAAQYSDVSNGSFYLANDIAADAAGNVYVTGYAYNESNSDYVTLKYDVATGQQLWIGRYNGHSNRNDEATALALDAAGNVLVTGSSGNNSGSNADYATLKYNGITGQQVWESRYEGPSTASASSEGARDLVVDAAGNVYVTGRTASSRSRSDYATVKYSAGGQQVWEARYDYDADDEATNVALDAAGNVYVTGSFYSLGSTDSNGFNTIKYQQNNVQQLWEARFNAATNGAEVATDIATDAAGNVFVTGYAYNGSNYDYATVKYSPTGQQLWEAHYDGNGDELPVELVVDAAGNVIVTGTSYGLNADYATVKYSPSGQQLWAIRFSGVSNKDDLAAGVAVDAAGNVYVTGTSYQATNYDYITCKYLASGQRSWVAGFIGYGDDADVATDIGVDAAGDVYVTGTSYAGTKSDYATVKYEGISGVPAWTSFYASLISSYNVAAGLAISAAGDLVVTGISDSGSSYDYATARYSSANGFQLWGARYNGPGNKDDLATSVAIDNNTGNVYVTGYSNSGGSTGWDYATLQYSRSGQQQWVARYDGPANSYDEATALVVDGAGNAYVTGLSYNNDGTDDYLTVKYSASGQQAWTARYNGPGNSYDEAAALSLDAAGNVYVTGFSLGSGTSYDFATLKYSQSTGIGPVALAGATPLVTASASLAVAAPTRQLQELAVYPNPATGPTTVSFRPVQDGAAQVQLYNQLGQKVASLYEGKVRKGQHYELPLNSEKLAAGLYTCSLLVNGQRESVRVLISR
ncbi:T9SS type A sorting domain-containing protein [Hymenobacter volaticus]|uniref:T9SS type A sorting domain-containing protein n=1 Tax=Hymenobacter volaticus TaxID=2932254 RepID=A0ABY4G1Q9_9BACT|nr:T9SS type A sorting domain-containing protein [Hymenobacter volaticus]UOQ64715.1 T9SS type A sorting domain-containing protein [Hymenobacter volaticus]